MSNVRRIRGVRASEQGLEKLNKAKRTRTSSRGNALGYAEIAIQIYLSPKTVERFFQGKAVEESSAQRIVDFFNLKYEEIVEPKNSKLSIIQYSHVENQGITNSFFSANNSKVIFNYEILDLGQNLTLAQSLLSNVLKQPLPIIHSQEPWIRICSAHYNLHSNTYLHHGSNKYSVAYLDDNEHFICVQTFSLPINIRSILHDIFKETDMTRNESSFELRLVDLVGFHFGKINLEQLLITKNHDDLLHIWVDELHRFPYTEIFYKSQYDTVQLCNALHKKKNTVQSAQIEIESVPTQNLYGSSWTIETIHSILQHLLSPSNPRFQFQFSIPEELSGIKSSQANMHHT